MRTSDEEMLDDDILKTAQAWRDAGKAVALATLVETWGSAQRPAGSLLVIDGDGRSVGSVSGGCIEPEVVRLARDVIAGGAPRLCEFGVSDETAQGVGLPCGGRIKVFVERVE